MEKSVNSDRITEHTFCSFLKLVEEREEHGLHNRGKGKSPSAHLREILGLSSSADKAIVGKEKSYSRDIVAKWVRGKIPQKAERLFAALSENSLSSIRSLFFINHFIVEASFSPDEKLMVIFREAFAEYNITADALPTEELIWNYFLICVFRKCDSGVETGRNTAAENTDRQTLLISDGLSNAYRQKAELLPEATLYGKRVAAFNYRFIIKNDSAIFYECEHTEDISFAFRYLHNHLIHTGGNKIVPVYINCREISCFEEILFRNSITDKFSAMSVSTEDSSIIIIILLDNISSLSIKSQSAVLQQIKKICKQYSQQIRVLISGTFIASKMSLTRLKVSLISNEKINSFFTANSIEKPAGLMAEMNFSMMKMYLEQNKNDYLNLPYYRKTPTSRTQFLANFIMGQKAKLFKKLSMSKSTIIARAESAELTELVFDELLPQMAFMADRERRKPAMIYENEMIGLLNKAVERRQSNLISGRNKEYLVSAAIILATESGLIRFSDKNHTAVYCFSERVYEVIFCQRYLALKIAALIHYSREFDNLPLSYKHAFSAFSKTFFEMYFISDKLIVDSDGFDTFIPCCLSEKRPAAFGTNDPESSGWIDELTDRCYAISSHLDNPHSRELYYLLVEALVILCRCKKMKSKITEAIKKHEANGCCEKLIHSMLHIMLSHPEDMIEDYVKEELTLLVCVYLRNTSNGDIREALNILSCLGVPRNRIYNEISSGEQRITGEWSSFINQTARLLDAAYQNEKRCLLRGTVCTYFDISDEDIAFSGEKADYSPEELNSPDNTETMLLRWEIIHHIVNRLLVYNANAYRSTASLNSLALYQAQRGNYEGAFICSHAALEQCYSYSTTLAYAQRKRAEYAVLALLSCRNKNDRERCVDMISLIGDGENATQRLRYERDIISNEYTDRIINLACDYIQSNYRLSEKYIRNHIRMIPLPIKMILLSQIPEKRKVNLSKSYFAQKVYRIKSADFSKPKRLTIFPKKLQIQESILCEFRKYSQSLIKSCAETFTSLSAEALTEYGRLIGADNASYCDRIFFTGKSNTVWQQIIQYSHRPSEEIDAATEELMKKYLV